MPLNIVGPKSFVDQLRSDQMLQRSEPLIQQVESVRQQALNGAMQPGASPPSGAPSFTADVQSVGVPSTPNWFSRSPSTPGAVTSQPRVSPPPWQDMGNPQTLAWGNQGIAPPPRPATPQGGFAAAVGKLEQWLPEAQKKTASSTTTLVGSGAGTGRTPTSASSSFPTSRTGDPSGGVEQWSDLVGEASKIYGVPPEIIKGIMHIESGGRADAVSPAGAMGLMQVMAGWYGADEDGMDPKVSVMKGTKILADNFKRYGDWDRAAAAYFGAIDAQGNITDASDVTGTTGSNYVRLFRDAVGRYVGGMKPSPEMEPIPLDRGGGKIEPIPVDNSPPLTGPNDPRIQRYPELAPDPSSTVTIRSRKSGVKIPGTPATSVGVGPGKYDPAEWEIVESGPVSMSQDSQVMSDFTKRMNRAPTPDEWAQLVSLGLGA